MTVPRLELMGAILGLRFTQSLLTVLELPMQSMTFHLQVDDVVLVMPDSPRGRWLLGRVVEVYPGRDSHTRVKVVCGAKTVIRPATKLILLGIN